MEGKIEDLTNLTPQQVDDKRLELCDRYQKYSDEMIQVEQMYNELWLKIREETKTNTETDRKVAISDIGKRRIYLKHNLKATEKKIGALKDRMQRLNNEAFNKY